jgi:hypothetical protein
MGKSFGSAFAVPTARPRTAISDEQVAAFAEGSEARPDEALGTQAPSTSSPRVLEKRGKTKLGKKKTILRASGRELRRIGVYFPSDVARELTIYCAEQEVEVSAFVVNAVRQQLARK